LTDTSLYSYNKLHPTTGQEGPERA